MYFIIILGDIKIFIYIMSGFYDFDDIVAGYKLLRIALHDKYIDFSMNTKSETLSNVPMSIYRMILYSQYFTHVSWW